MFRWSIILAVAAGGAAGSLLRYGISSAISRHVPAATFPLGTLAVNLIGCLAIGFCYVWLEQRGGPALRSFIQIGLLGALTTFSTYSIESIALMEKGRHLAAAGNLAGSVVACLIAAFAGIVLARLVFQT